jgi:hypothetical protein
MFFAPPKNREESKGDQVIVFGAASTHFSTGLSVGTIELKQLYYF